ncbi:MAG TPA: endo-1,4-beta-xylanase [Candidatus Saccharimonadales bacterium]|nr:endo-1,4-beta-xylanase [Candidatus Saccharimonadales bacterium]
MARTKNLKNKKSRRKGLSREHQLIILGILCVIFAGILYWYFSLRPPQLLNPPLKDLASQHHIALGVHVDPSRLGSSIYPDIVTSQFSYITMDGGGTHFNETQLAPTIFDYGRIDKMVDFAEANDMPVQYHHLVWGDQHYLPDWLKKGNYSNEQIMQILHDHINSIVDRYKGRIKEYTVVNEAFGENQHIFGLHNWFADKLGDQTNYIDQLFRWAHEDDPHAKLILNDFDNETRTPVSDAMFTYIKLAKARGVPIDGIGMQMHIDANHPPEKQQIINNMKRFKQIGVPVYVTEYDINTNYVKGNNTYKQYLEAKITKDVVGACIESKNCVSFDVFGLTNKNDFIKKLTHTQSRAYILDSRYRPRQQYYAFRSAW